MIPLYIKLETIPNNRETPNVKIQTLISLSKCERSSIINPYLLYLSNFLRLKSVSGKLLNLTAFEVDLKTFLLRLLSLMFQNKLKGFFVF
jgi:hypothetical protein